MAKNGRYVRVATKFWNDEKIRELSEDARFLYLYILTSPHSNMAGYYVLPKPYAMYDLQWEMERLDKAFTKLLDEGVIKYSEESSVILIPKFMKYNPIQNTNQAKGANKRLQELPDNNLIDDFVSVCEQYAEGYIKQLCKGLVEGLPERYGNTDTDTESDTETDNISNSASEEERKILNILKSVDKYPFDFERDIEHIRELMTDFPDVEFLEEVKKWRSYKRDKPLTKKSNARLQLRNWMDNASKWRPKDDNDNKAAKDNDKWKEYAKRGEK